MEQVQQKGLIEIRIATLYYKPFSVTKRALAKPTAAAETAKRVKVGLLNQLVEEFLKEVLEDRKC
jgi:hypothetical protein